MLTVENISKSYRHTLALSNLSFSVMPGEILGIVGLNGSGKTTTFRLLLQLLEPDSGRILLEGEEISSVSRNEFGYLPEERSLYRDLSVRRHLTFLGSLRGMNQAEIDESINKWKKELEFSYDLDKRISQLSKGNQQKVQLMGSLLHNPKVLILDEPFSGMDPYNVELMKQLFLNLQKQGKYILLSTHRLDHVESFCNSLIFLKHGECVLKGKVSELRKTTDKRVISIIDDIPLYKIKDLIGDFYIEKEGHQFKIYCENDSEAKKCLELLIKKLNCLSITYSYPSLEDLFLEK